MNVFGFRSSRFWQWLRNADSRQYGLADRRLVPLVKHFPYLNPEQWHDLLVAIRKKPTCPPHVRDDLLRFAFRTRPAFDPMVDTKLYGEWVVFVLRVLWPVTAGLTKAPRARDIAKLLSRTKAMGQLLYGSELDYNRILKHPDLKPENADTVWTDPQQLLLESLANYGENSADFDRSFVYTWSEEGEARFIVQVMERIHLSREPYPPQDLERGERHLWHHYTLHALLYVMMVAVGIVFVRFRVPLSRAIMLSLLFIPVTVFVLAIFIWGFPPLLPHLVDFLNRSHKSVVTLRAYPQTGIFILKLMARFVSGKVSGAVRRK